MVTLFSKTEMFLTLSKVIFSADIFKFSANTTVLKKNKENIKKILLFIYLQYSNEYKKT